MKLFGFLILLLSGIPASWAGSLPVGWPWHGVSMDNLSSSPSDLDRYKKELDIDVIRLQLKPVKLAVRKSLAIDVAWKDSLVWLDQMLDQCEKLGVKAIVNLSHFPVDPQYHPNPKIRIAQYTPDFWDDRKQLEGVVQVVGELVTHLKDRGAEFAAIDIMSEPAVRDGKLLVAPKLWRSLNARLIAEVRKISPKLWFVVSPPPQGLVANYKDFVPFNDAYIIYSIHMYSPSTFAAQGIAGKTSVGVSYPGYIDKEKWDKTRLNKEFQYLRVFQSSYKTPVMVGEFSAVRWAKGGEQYIKDLVSIFDEYGWSWLYFSGTGWHGWNPDYNQNYPGKGGDWKADYVGDKSERWKTLKEIFGVRQQR